jgi:ABC-type transporter Mla MlaB component
MATSRTAIVVDAEALAADVSTIDALARLQLNAQRIGQMIRLHNASTELRQLIEFAGLSEVLRVEPRGQTEQREEPLGVEEEGELPDPAA